MKNFKLTLTTKSEVLSYLENKKISLQRKKDAAFLLEAVGSGIMGFQIAGLLVATEPVVINNFNGFANVTLFCAGLMLRMKYSYEERQMRYRLQKTEQKIGWIKEGTFVKNTMLELENEVVEAREEKMTKVKTR